jgi:SAM-dependent methyltransferase
MVREAAAAMTTSSGDDPTATWDAVADGWERHHDALRRHTRALEERMLEVSAPAPGETVLEVAAGLGELSRTVAAQVAPGGEVICSDAAPGMVDAARRGQHPIGLRFEVLDAHQLPLADDALDLVLCKMGLMLFADPVRAAVECRRVLQPRGRLVAATWGPAEDNPWLVVFAAAMLTHGHGPPGDPNAPGGIFSLSDPTTLTELLTIAGFADVEVETVEVPEHVESFDDYWRRRTATSGPLTVLLRHLPSDQVARIRDTCEEFAAVFRGGADGSYCFPGRALLVRAR